VDTQGKGSGNGGPEGRSKEGALLRIGDFLGLERNVLVMVVAASLRGLGEYLWNGFLPLVLELLGASGRVIGMFGMVSGLVGAVAPYPGGLLSDRLGPGRALILASGLYLAGYLVYLLSPVWWPFLVGVVLISLAGSFYFVGSLTLTGDRLPEERRATSIGVQEVIRRLSWAVAPPLGGLLLGSSLGALSGFRVAVGLTIVLTGVAILLQRWYYRLPVAAPARPPLHPIVIFRSLRTELKHLLLAESLLRFGQGMYQMFLILYVMEVFAAGTEKYGLLMGLATGTSIACYLPVSRLADRMGRASRGPYMAVSFLFVTAFPLALLCTGRAAWLIPLFILQGLREFGEPARKALIMDLLPQAGRGEQMGAYYMLRGIVLFPAPFVGGMLWEWQHTSPFLVGGLVSAVGLLWFLLKGLLLRNRTTAMGVST
jgi:MFS family permease